MMAQLSDLALWCVVQADGDRMRLTSHGAVPIQYWRTQESPALIQRSLHRALRIVKPQQIVATVADAHRRCGAIHRGGYRTTGASSTSRVADRRLRSPPRWH